MDRASTSPAAIQRPSTFAGSTYAAFLARKAQLDEPAGFAPTWMPTWLFPFQAALAHWAVEHGRAALFADCGLGKTPMELVWAENVRRHTGRPVLIVAPLAVTFQLELEAHKFEVDAATSRDGSVPAGVTITNYDRLHHFDTHQFGGVVCDESSAIKCFDGQRRALVTEFLRTQRYRLLCTATAAPNDYIELGTSSEALGHLGHMDMLARFFTNRARTARAHRGKFRPKEREGWRLKGHAEDPFWRWVSSWARAMRRPSDLGFDDGGFVLPPLELREHVVGESVPDDGALFAVSAMTLREERAELRRTLGERCERAAELLAGEAPGIAWCHLNDESALLARLIDGAVEVRGSDHPDAKEQALRAFTAGEMRALVTKPAIGAWGLNWQHCSRMTFFPSHSYEQYYQAVRRCWRFGQTRPVLVDVITTPAGAHALKSLERKTRQADRMFGALTTHMRQALALDRTQTYDVPLEIPAWLTS
jgi:hypothetical protein